MVYNCVCYKRNANGTLDSQIVPSDSVPEGWNPDPAKLDEVQPEEQPEPQAEDAPKAKRAYRKKKHF